MAQHGLPDLTLGTVVGAITIRIGDLFVILGDGTGEGV